MSTINLIDFINENSGIFALIFSFIVALSTVFYALLTWKLVVETKRLRSSQTQAKLAIYIDFKTTISFAYLTVKNVGQGPAYDIDFTVSPIDIEKCDEKTMSRLQKIKFLETGVNSPPAKAGGFG